MSENLNMHYPFENPPLPYPYSAIEPFISEQTMQIHHNRHLQGYVNKLNDTLRCYPEYHNWSLEKLIRRADKLPKEIALDVKNNAGGVYNHIFFFNGLGSSSARIATQELANKIDVSFGSLEDFESDFKRTALAVFGSGYLWLVYTANGRLKLVPIANQETPITADFCPIMCIDVWEHAYYLQHLNDRAAYIDTFLDSINWQEAEKNYTKCRRTNCVVKQTLR